jgi:shikimate dehydrogenase
MGAIIATAPRLGVMGWPVAHSLSPVMQNAALRALGLPWTYDLLPVQPPDLAAAVQALRAGGFVGANVTVPHKQAIIPHLDGVTPAASAIGAVNTLFWRLSPPVADANPAAPIGAPSEADVEFKHLFGDNTDGIGFMTDLAAHGIAATSQRVLVIGGGGAARAVVYALAAAGASVTIVNRTVAHAQAIATLVSTHFPAANLSCAAFPEGLASAAAGAGLVVNTTSVGMWPSVEVMPWDPDLAFRPDQIVYDLVYTPRMTALLRKAQMDGARVMDGLGMLVEQGAAALTRWTGRPAPVAVMRAAVEAALAQRQLSNDH